jgi:hypothetical protein
MFLVQKSLNRVFTVACLNLLIISAVVNSRAQSIDINVPTPVTSYEIEGTIAARDLGDSRFTDHYYAFVGTPGDVLMTIKGNNLNGDVDVFTAGTLRPLLKFTMYAESSSPITKAIYLRKRENLILRIEARSPNDDEGNYRIRFGGSFEALPKELAENATTSSEANAAVTTATAKKGRRVSSVGARIAEPPPQVIAAAPTPEPTPKATVEKAPAEAPASTATLEKTSEAVTPNPPTPAPRRGRGRVPAARRKRAPLPKQPTETADSNQPADKEKPADSEAEAKPAAARRSGKRGASNADASPPPEPQTETGPRLIIELRDGTRAERFMSTIRRVTVENGQIVVVGRDGKIERVRMVNVIRMSIEP